MSATGIDFRGLLRSLRGHPDAFRLGLDSRFGPAAGWVAGKAAARGFRRVPVVRVESPKQLRADVALARPRVRVGSAANADLVLAHASVKPEHAILTVRLDLGRVTIAPVSPDTKVSVNGHRIHSPCSLRSADRVEVGRVALRCEDLSFEEVGREPTARGAARASLLLEEGAKSRVRWRRAAWSTVALVCSLASAVALHASSNSARSASPADPPATVRPAVSVVDPTRGVAALVEPPRIDAPSARARRFVVRARQAEARLDWRAALEAWRQVIASSAPCTGDATCVEAEAAIRRIAARLRTSARPRTANSDAPPQSTPRPTTPSGAAEDREIPAFSHPAR